MIRGLLALFGFVSLLTVVFIAGCVTGFGTTCFGVAQMDMKDGDGKVYHFEPDGKSGIKLVPGPYIEYENKLKKAAPGSAKPVDPAPGKKFCYVPEFKMTVVRADEEGNWKEWRP